MAGAFSGRLVNSYQPNSPFNSSVVTHESMSFNPNMHGTPFAQQSFSLFGSQSNDSVSEETARKIASLQVKLNQKLGPEFISQRPGPGGGPKLTYAEGWKVINLANEVFGFNGWSSSIVSLTTDFVDFNEATGKYNVGVTAIVRVTLRDGTYHEDIGYGLLDNGRQKGAALDKVRPCLQYHIHELILTRQSKKEAVTDAIKRSLRNFGNVLGNCLYDKSYTSEVLKMKVPPVRCSDLDLSDFTILSFGLQAKFKKDELHRLPEFDDVKPDIPSMSASTSANTSTKPPYPNQYQANAVTPTRQPIQQNQTKSLSSIPAHVRSEIPSFNSTSSSSTGNIIQADVKGKGPAHPTGLNTPITPHLPPQRPNLNPPQYQHQPDRKVSFADQALVAKPPSAAATMKAESKPSTIDSEGDESFGFNSDDDAFFALADLGPPIDADGADVGRPIDSDEGRPIDPEGFSGDATDAMIGDDVFDQHQYQENTESSAVDVVSASKLSRRETIAAALMPTENKTGSTPQGHAIRDERQPSGSGSGSSSNPTTSRTGTGTSMAPGMLNKMQANTGTNSSLSLSGLGVRSSLPPPPPQQQQNQNQHSSLNLTCLVQQRPQRQIDQRQTQNENHNPIPSTTRDESKRVSTPSIGGFHLPSGIVIVCSSRVLSLLIFVSEE